ncbi:MAG TPA: hypothetical protein VNN25_09200, partial [Thermoanaerobaculia bacterium]|nr:hypothetical protein [Thermoanaerobaculia bacterium]
GQLLDRPSILIASGTTATLGYPDVIFVGGAFLVAYPTGTSVVVRRFSTDGRPIDIQPVVISNSAMAAWLATNGSTVFLPTARNRFRLLAADGTPLGPEREVPNAGFGSFSVASNGDRYLIAYPAGPDKPGQGAFVILNANGDSLLSKPIPLADSLFLGHVTASANGSSFLISMATNGPVRCMFVDADGNASALRTLDTQSAGSIIATWSGTEYNLVWPRTLSTATRVTGHDIVGARVDASGTPIDTTPVTIAPSQPARYGTAFASAWNGRDTIIITGDSDGDDTNWRTTAAIFKSLPQIDAEPSARRRAAIASSAAEQASGSIASNGTLSLVTWRESSGFDQAVVRAAFIAADGQLGSPIDLGAANAQTTTATASNGMDFLVAYVDTQSHLVARRVTLEGVLDPAPIVITPYGVPTDAMAIGWSGQAYVVVTAGGYAVTLSGISWDGTVTLSRQVVNTSVHVDSPAVSCAANACSVTWHLASPLCFFDPCVSTENDVFARTSADGTLVLQASLTDSVPITSALSLAAADGRSVFVYSSDKSMFAQRITAGGVVLDTPALNGGVKIMTSETSFALQPVAVVHSGLYFVEPDNDTSGRLYWTRIEPEPKPHVTSLINLHQSVSLPLTMTASSRNAYLLYSIGEDDPQLMAPRLYLRTIDSPDPQPGSTRRRSTR